MKISRRATLIAAGVPLAFAQQPENSLSITAASGLRMVQHDNAQSPAVAVFLPSTKEAAAVIEMPEHAWLKENQSDQQTWFYRMYTADPALRGQVEWSKNGDTLSYAMSTASGFRLNCHATLDDDGVAIEYEIVSNSVPQAAAAQAVTCVKLYRPFTDLFLERTYVHHPEGIELIAAETPDRLRKNAEEWLPCTLFASEKTRRPRGTGSRNKMGLQGTSNPVRPMRPSSPRSRNRVAGRLPLIH